jgi:hypothetical protein
MNKYIVGYRLNGKIPVPCYDTLEWATAFEYKNRRIALTEFENGDRVSTVFLGINHNYSNKGAPILFETMIFGGEHDGYQERYCTWEEAEEGHKRAVELYFEVTKSFHAKGFKG